MSVTNLLRKMASGQDSDLCVCIFQALIAGEGDELADVAERAADSGRFPVDFTYDLEALAAWRSHYYDKALSFGTEAKAKIEDMDDAFTLRLVEQVRGF